MKKTDRLFVRFLIQFIVSLQNTAGNLAHYGINTMITTPGKFYRPIPKRERAYERKTDMEGLSSDRNERALDSI